MIKMKSLLAENMLRFGTKNLTESQKRQLNEEAKAYNDFREYENMKSELQRGTSEVNGFFVRYGNGARMFKDGCILIWNGSLGIIYGPTYATEFNASQQFSTKDAELARANAKTMLSVISDNAGKGGYIGELPFTGDAVLSKAAEFFDSAFISQNLNSFITQIKLPAPTKIKTKNQLQTAMSPGGSLSKIPKVLEKYHAIVNAFGLV